MARVPIVRVGDVVIAAVQEDLHDRDVLQLQQDLNEALERTAAHGVLLDVSVLESIDSFLGRALGDTARGARLLGARTVIVGIQPAVAITLVELGLKWEAVPTALNAEKGMALLRRLLAEDARPIARRSNGGGRGTPLGDREGEANDAFRHYPG